MPDIFDDVAAKKPQGADDIFSDLANAQPKTPPMTLSGIYDTARPDRSLSERAARAGAPSPDVLSFAPKHFDATSIPRSPFSGDFITAPPMLTEEEKKRAGSIGPSRTVHVPGSHGTQLQIPADTGQGLLRALGAGAAEDSTIGRFKGQVLTGSEMQREAQGGLRLFAPEQLMTEAEQQRHPILTGAGEFAGGMTTPDNLLLLGLTGGAGELAGPGATVVKRLMSAGFSIPMLVSAARTTPEISSAIRRKDYDTAERLATQATLTVITAGLAGRGMLEEPKPTTVPKGTVSGPLAMDRATGRAERRFQEFDANQAARRGVGELSEAERGIEAAKQARINAPVEIPPRRGEAVVLPGRPLGPERNPLEVEAQRVREEQASRRPDYNVVDTRRVKPAEEPAPPYYEISPQKPRETRRMIVAPSAGETIGTSRVGRYLQSLIRKAHGKVEPSAAAAKSADVYRRVIADESLPHPVREAARSELERITTGRTSPAKKAVDIFEEVAAERNPLEKAEASSHQRQQAQLYTNRLKNPVEREYAQSYLHARLAGGLEPERIKSLPASRAKDIASNVESYLKREQAKPVAERFPSDVLEEAHAELRAAHGLTSSFERPGRYHSDLGPEANAREQDKAWYGVTSSRKTVAYQHPWYADESITPGKLADAVQRGKGADYERIVGKIAEGIQAERESARPILEEYSPALRTLAEQVRDTAPDLASSLLDLAEGRARGFKNLREYIEGKITDAQQAAEFSRVIEEAAAEARESASTEEVTGHGGEAREGSSREEVPPVRELNESVLPGMERAVSEQREAAGREQGRKLTEEVRRPPESIEAKAGTMERESPLFRGTPASPQREIFRGKDIFDDVMQSGRQERRQNVAQRQRVAEMTQEEMKRELLTSPITGLPNRRAFEEAGASRAVAMSDADGLKALNDRFGYEGGNELLRAKADALREAGVEAYHDKGDEFLYRDKSPQELQAKLESARKILRNKVIEATMTDGTTRRFKGADFSYGHGKDLTEAEAGLKTNKSEREARGERARGELRGITEIGSEKGEVHQGAEEKVVAREPGTTLYSNAFLDPEAWRQAFPGVTHALGKFGKTELTDEWESQASKDQLDFILREQRGQKQVSATDQAMADRLRAMFAERRQAVENLGHGAFKRWRENYFPQMWERPSEIRDWITKVLAGKRQMEGPKSFTKQRVFDDIQEGIDAGFKPVTTNPVVLALAKLHEMDRYIMAHTVLDTMKKTNLAKAVFVGQDAPAGWERLPEGIATIYGSSEIPVKEAYDKVVWDRLSEVAKNLGIEHTRGVAIGGKRLGFATPGKITTRFATPESVVAHEIGHNLDWKYGLKDKLVKNPLYAKELRALADLHIEGMSPADVPQSFQRYIRKGEEKMATMVEALIHAPEKFRQVAPNTWDFLQKFIGDYPALKPLIEAKPSLRYDTRTSPVSAGGMVIRGYYYAPADAAHVFGNYLSPGLQRFKAYNAVRMIGNTLNQAQLGLSAFHLGFTALDSSVSDLALGLERISRGEVWQSMTPAMRSFTILGSPINTMLKGNKLLREYMEPGKFEEMAALADAVAQAGGRVHIDPYYKNQAIESFWKAWKQGSYGKAGLRAFPAAMEYAAKPVMEYAVPRMKLGVFANLAEDVLARSERENWQRTKTRHELNRAWDSVDNRMGQIVYDNLFWNRTVKDLGLVSVRSLGWNLGTAREVGGGGLDIARQVARLAAGEKAELTHRMAYVMALPIVVGFTGAVIHYLSTGKKPETLTDYYFPQTGKIGPNGRPERLSLPSYIKDLVELNQHPTRTVLNKVHPAITATAQFLRNEDYFGTEIHHPDDPFLRQRLDDVEFIAKQFLPFSIRNAYQRAQSAGETGVAAPVKERSLLGTAESMIGLVPAPSSLMQSKAERMAHEDVIRQMPQGPRTREQFEHSTLIRNYENRLRSGEMTLHDLRGEVAAGRITGHDAERVSKSMQSNPLGQDFARLSLGDALDVWNAASAEERKQLRSLLVRKQSQLEKMPAEKRRVFEKRMREALYAARPSEPAPRSNTDLVPSWHSPMN
jgi:GGDEF domain-containing protein/uncharacterized protein (UPF0147 family)